KLNVGGSNIRGIQKAAQYYYGKDISECNLVEGALLAGVINAPAWYNPFYNLEDSQDRIIEVLYQMYHHGYITKAEYDLAKTVRIEDLLKDPYSSKGDGEGIPYQAYIDAVVSEVIDLTGLDPYTTTMHIYTHMIKGIQEQMDDIQAGNFEEGYLYYPDEYFEVASVCIENSTGKVVGILGGRNYANGGQLLLNHATEQYKQPGSSIKPILDYALAFENLGWATDHVLCDRPMWLDPSNSIVVYNDSGTYVGDVTLKQALGQSINTCAIQTLQNVLNEKKYEYVVNYAQSLGYDFNLDDFNVQYAVGGSTCEVSPYQHASAYTAIMNYGVYNQPHTVERIEFTNGKSPITPTYESTQVISEAAAYLTTELMKSNVSDYGGTYNYVKSADYTVYGKTGTTDYGTSGKDYGIPSGAIKDGWLVAATSEYTTATWVGYEKAVSGQQSYILKDYYYNDRPQGKIAHLILEAAYVFGNSKPSQLSKPSDVTSITHIIGTWPYAAYQEDMDPALRTTGLIKSDSVKLVNLPAPTIKDISNDYKVTLEENGLLTISWPEYPDKEKLEGGSDVKDISLKNAAGDVIVAATGTNLFDYTKLYGPIRYMADLTISGSQEVKEHIVSKNRSEERKLKLNPGDSIKIDLYYGYENGSTVSNKVSYEKKADVSFTVPKANTSRQKLEEWANKYSFITFRTEETYDIPEPCWVFTDGINPIGYETTIHVTDPNQHYVLTYYVEKDHSLSIPVAVSGDNKSFTVKANYDEDSTFLGWFYHDREGLIFEEDGDKLIVRIMAGYEESLENVSVTVQAKTDYKSAEVTLTIINGEFVQ
ncbi:MAG: transglycosylase domain-containing protein, partial [Erysipelotrichaceae bacterium]|nr:transglycosylase domain-containing protein [Erysipelotrichaceae bacterium]